MLKKLLIIFIVILFPLASSQSLNSSDIWITNQGDLDNIPDLYPTLDNQYLTTSGSSEAQETITFRKGLKLLTNQKIIFSNLLTTIESDGLGSIIAYVGSLFQINGSLWVSDDVTIMKNLYVKGNTNGILYVEQNNEDDIQEKINQCNSSGCVVIIPPGNYALKNWIDLKSDLTLINYGNLFYAQTFQAKEVQDHSANNPVIHNFMFYANGKNKGDLKNIRFINRGIIEPRPIPSDSIGFARIMMINNATNIEIEGGHIRNLGTNANTNKLEGYGIHNSDYISVHDIFTEGLGSSVWQECTSQTNIYDIRGYGLEAIDMNGYSKEVIISNINMEGTGSNEIIDINGNKNVVLNNIIGKNGKRLLSITEFAGIRMGECFFSDDGNITGTNLRAENMQFPSIITSPDVFLTITENGKTNIIGPQNHLNSLTVNGVPVCLQDGTNCPTTNIFSLEKPWKKSPPIKS